MAASKYGAPTKGSTGNRGGIPAMRAILIKAGFHVRKSGPSTPRLMNAWKAYNNRANANHWNAAHTKLDQAKRGFAPSPEDIRTSKGGVNYVAPKAKNKKAPKANISTAVKAAKNAKSSKASSSGGGVAANDGLKLIPTAMAKQIADLQFGGDISAAKQAIAQGLAQNKGNLSNIQDWTKQVQDQIVKSQAATQAGYQQASADEGTNAAALAAAMGGNAGSNLVRAQGQLGQNLAAEQGASANAFSENQKVVMAQAAAQASQNEQNLGSQRNTAAQLNLQDILGKQGASQAESLMNILQQNNQIRQQKFSNNLSALQTQAALAMSGAQMSNLMTQTAMMKSQGSGTSWSAQLQKNPALMMSIMQEAGVIDPKTGALLPQFNVNKAKDMVRQTLLGHGWKNAAGANKGNLHRNQIQNQMLHSIISNVQAAYGRRSAIPAGQSGAAVNA